MTTTFEEGALVFAKMKGFPFWPAKVINTQTAPAKYCVSFFGSRETAFVKASDIVDYLENRNIYERKNPKREEFRLAVEEIRKEAGLPLFDEVEVKQEVNDVEVKQEPGGYGNGIAAFSETVPTAMDASAQPSSSSFGRVRKPSYRVSDKDFVQPGYGGRNRNNSNSFNMDFGFERQRTDSNASLFGLRKRNGPSFTMDYLNDVDFNPNNFLQGDLGNVFDFDSDGLNGINHTRRRRRTTSKLLDEILGGPNRDRTFSTSSDAFRNDTNLLDLFESAGNILDPAMFYNAIDLLPSEESDRPQTPENISHMPGNNYCQKCYGKLKFVEDQWKCTNTACVDNDVKLEEFDSLFYDMPTNNNAVGSNFFGHKPTKQRKKKKSISNEILDEEDSSPSRQPGRPRSYKVEKTPAVQDGVRLCIFCNGHVRPQMCGGNKHRWRCVDKRCRKWYGWVRSNEEIPKDLGKKGRWKDLVLKVQGHTDDGKLVPMLPNQQEEVEVTDVKLKRTATTKKKRANNAPPPLSPLPEDRIAFQATPLEMRAHWWRPERKRVEPSPERDIEPGIVDTAAVMRLAEQSNRAASITTKSMEHSGRHQIDTGTATGFIDLMFDQIFASIGPLMALATNLPHMQKYNSNEIRADLFSTVENLPLLNP